MIRIYADFNERDAEGRVVLCIPGSLKDIEQHRPELRSGLVVQLYTPGELQCLGTLEFDEYWRAVPDFSTVEDLDG